MEPRICRVLNAILGKKTHALYKMKEFCDKHVLSFHEVPYEYKKDGIVIVARIIENHAKSIDMLKNAGFENIIPRINQIQIFEKLDGKRRSDICTIFGKNAIFDIPESIQNRDANVKIYAVTSASNNHLDTIIRFFRYAPAPVQSARCSVA